MKYALYLGCTVPVRALNYEASTRKVAEKLGIEFADINSFACCGYPLKAVDVETSTLLAARTLAIAEEQGLDICTLCSACTGTLTEVNQELKEDDKLRKEINGKLKGIGKQYKGSIDVKHFARILYEDVGIDAIRKKVSYDLSGFKFAVHYGCHYLKPKEAFDCFDDPENPESLDELITVTGAESVWYEDRKECCGGAVLGIKEETALAITRDKLNHIKTAGADGLIVICPFCDVMYEQNQKKLEKQFETEYKIPVLYYPQVLGLALGISSDELGFKQNRVKPKELLEKFAPAV